MARLVLPQFLPKVRIKSVLSSTQALEILQQEKFDVIISDYQMPELNGLDVLSHLRTQNNLTPFIILTGHGREEVAIQALNLGGDYYLQKGEQLEPIFKELSLYIKACIERDRIRQELIDREHRYYSLFEESQNVLFEQDFSKLKEFRDTLKNKGITNYRGYFASHPDELKLCASLITTLDANKAAVKLYKVRDKKDLLVTLDNLFTPEAYKIFTEQLIALFDDKSFITQEQVNKDYIGNLIYIRVGITIPQEYQKNWKRVLVSIIDITKEKSEAQYVQQFQNILNVLPTPIVISQLSTDAIVYANQAVSNLLQIPLDQLMGRSRMSVFVNSDDSHVINDIEYNGTVDNLELMAKKADNSFVWILYSGTLINFMNAECILSTAIDITAKKDTEAILHSQIEELDQFAKIMAHDLRNYLSAIEGYSRVLFREIDFVKGDWKINRLIPKILKQTQNAYKLLRKSLYLAQAGNIIDKKRRVDLSLLVAEVADIIIPKSIHFKQSNLPVISGDREKLYQLFKNLMENAILHGKASLIKIESVSEDDKYFVVRISNNGILIPPHQKTLIHRKKTQGFGMLIINKIVHAHNWDIILEEQVQELTTFALKIPFPNFEENRVSIV